MLRLQTIKKSKHFMVIRIYIGLTCFIVDALLDDVLGYSNIVTALLPIIGIYLVAMVVIDLIGSYRPIAT